MTSRAGRSNFHGRSSHNILVVKSICYVAFHFTLHCGVLLVSLNWIFTPHNGLILGCGRMSVISGSAWKFFSEEIPNLYAGTYGDVWGRILLQLPMVCFKWCSSMPEAGTGLLSSCYFIEPRTSDYPGSSVNQTPCVPLDDGSVHYLLSVKFIFRALRY